jgi:hypothetical protein
MSVVDGVSRQLGGAQYAPHDPGTGGEVSDVCQQQVQCLTSIRLAWNRAAARTLRTGGLSLPTNPTGAANQEARTGRGTGSWGWSRTAVRARPRELLSRRFEADTRNMRTAAGVVGVGPAPRARAAIRRESNPAH